MRSLPLSLSVTRRSILASELTSIVVAHLDSAYQGDACMRLELSHGALTGREGVVVHPAQLRHLED